jgi:hypothetical protein
MATGEFPSASLGMNQNGNGGEERKKERFGEGGG